MKMIRRLMVPAALAFGLSVVAGCSGLQGRVVWVEPYAGSLGPVTGARIVFTHKNGKIVRSTNGDIGGEYKIDLPPGLYDITVTAPTCKDYTSPAPAHVSGGSYAVSDIYMEKKK